MSGKRRYHALVSKEQFAKGLTPNKAGSMSIYRVLSLDVWGHGPDQCEACGCSGGDQCLGYEVNASHHVGRVTLDDDADDVTTIRVLQAHQFLNDVMAPELFTIDATSDEDHIDINLKSDGKPLLSLEKI